MSQPKDLQEAIAQLQSMLAQMDPSEDYTTIFNAEEKMEISRNEAEKEIEELNVKLKGVQKLYESALVSSRRPSTVPSAENHASTMNKLDKQRLSLGKAIQDGQAQVTSKEEELAHLKDRVRELEASDPASKHLEGAESTILRLELLRSLGFEPVLERNRVSKVFVRSESQNVHIVDLNGGPEASPGRANSTWKLLSS